MVRTRLGCAAVPMGCAVTKTFRGVRGISALQTTCSIGHHNPRDPAAGDMSAGHTAAVVDLGVGTARRQFPGHRKLFLQNSSFLGMCAHKMSSCGQLWGSSNVRPSTTTNFTAVGGESPVQYEAQNPGPPSSDGYFGNNGPGAPTPSEAAACNRAAGISMDGTVLSATAGGGGLGAGSIGTGISWVGQAMKLDSVIAAGDSIETMGIGAFAGGVAFTILFVMSWAASGVACG